jgi:oxalate decarboxylase/phosphoglucose isomerase-like protein (cupin superfamily)
MSETKILFFKAITPKKNTEQTPEQREKGDEAAGKSAAAEDAKIREAAGAAAAAAAQTEGQGASAEDETAEDGGDEPKPKPMDDSTVEEGHHVAFKAGSFKGAGKVTAKGKDGCVVKDKTGREHNIHWHELTGHHTGEGDE